MVLRGSGQAPDTTRAPSSTPHCDAYLTLHADADLCVYPKVGACTHIALLVLLLQSGKLVQKMFGKIQEMIADKDALVCVLIDEVESLTAARKSAMAGSEPSDAIRVVNALLTQIDQIRRCVLHQIILGTYTHMYHHTAMNLHEIICIVTRHEVQYMAFSMCHIYCHVCIHMHILIQVS